MEEGASRAVGLSGNSYVARPIGGGFALYYGGQHIGNHPDEAACVKAADGYETYRTSTKGPSA